MTNIVVTIGNSHYLSCGTRVSQGEQGNGGTCTAQWSKRGLQANYDQVEKILQCWREKDYSAISNIVQDTLEDYSITGLQRELTEAYGTCYYNFKLTNDIQITVKDTTTKNEEGISNTYKATERNFWTVLKDTLGWTDLTNVINIPTRGKADVIITHCYSPESYQEQPTGDYHLVPKCSQDAPVQMHLQYNLEYLQKRCRQQKQPQISNGIKWGSIKKDGKLKVKVDSQTFGKLKRSKTDSYTASQEELDKLKRFATRLNVELKCENVKIGEDRDHGVSRTQTNQMFTQMITAGINSADEGDVLVNIGGNISQDQPLMEEPQKWKNQHHVIVQKASDPKKINYSQFVEIKGDGKWQELIDNLKDYIGHFRVFEHTNSEIKSRQILIMQINAGVKRCSDLYWGLFLPHLIKVIIGNKQQKLHYLMCDASYYTGGLIQGILVDDPRVIISDISNSYNVKKWNEACNTTAENKQATISVASTTTSPLPILEVETSGNGHTNYTHPFIPEVEARAKPLAQLNSQAVLRKETQNFNKFTKLLGQHYLIDASQVRRNKEIIYGGWFPHYTPYSGEEDKVQVGNKDEHIDVSIIRSEIRLANINTTAGKEILVESYKNLLRCNNNGVIMNTNLSNTLQLLTSSKLDTDEHNQSKVYQALIQNKYRLFLTADEEITKFTTERDQFTQHVINVKKEEMVNLNKNANEYLAGIAQELIHLILDTQQIKGLNSDDIPVHERITKETIYEMLENKELAKRRDRMDQVQKENQKAQKSPKYLLIMFIFWAITIGVVYFRKTHQKHGEKIIEIIKNLGMKTTKINEAINDIPIIEGITRCDYQTDTNQSIANVIKRGYCYWTWWKINLSEMQSLSNETTYFFYVTIVQQILLQLTCMDVWWQLKLIKQCFTIRWFRISHFLKLFESQSERERTWRGLEWKASFVDTLISTIKLTPIFPYIVPTPLSEIYDVYSRFINHTSTKKINRGINKAIRFVTPEIIYKTIELLYHLILFLLIILIVSLNLITIKYCITTWFNMVSQIYDTMPKFILNYALFYIGCFLNLIVYGARLEQDMTHWISMNTLEKWEEEFKTKTTIGNIKEDQQNQANELIKQSEEFLYSQACWDTMHLISIITFQIGLIIIYKQIYRQIKNKYAIKRTSWQIDFKSTLGLTTLQKELDYIIWMAKQITSNYTTLLLLMPIQLFDTAYPMIDILLIIIPYALINWITHTEEDYFQMMERNPENHLSRYHYIEYRLITETYAQFYGVESVNRFGVWEQNIPQLTQQDWMDKFTNIEKTAQPTEQNILDLIKTGLRMRIKLNREKFDCLNTGYELTPLVTKEQPNYNEILLNEAKKNIEIEEESTICSSIEQYEILEENRMPNNTPGLIGKHELHFGPFKQRMDPGGISAGILTGNYSSKKIEEEEKQKDKYQDHHKILSKVTYDRNGQKISLEDFKKELDQDRDKGAELRKLVSFPQGPVVVQANSFNAFHASHTRMTGAHTIADTKLVEEIKNEYVDRLKSSYDGIRKEYIVDNMYEVIGQIKMKLQSIDEYISQISDTSKRNKYAKDYKRWKENGYQDFKVRANMVMKKNEWLYCALDELRSRLIADPQSAPLNELHKRTITGIGDALFKAVVGAISYNIVTLTKYLQHKSNESYVNHLYFIHATHGSDIATLLDHSSEELGDNVFIATDGSQFDSTRSRPLRELDIACYDFYLEEQLDFMQIPKFAQFNLIRIMRQIDHEFIMRLQGHNGLINLKMNGTIKARTLSGFCHHTTLGNGNTILAMNHWISKGIKSVSLAAGDDNVMGSHKKDSKYLEARYKQITNKENKPEKGTVGIIVKKFVESTDSTEFLSKNYTWPGNFTPQPLRFIKRGVASSSTTKSEVIRNSVYRDQQTALRGFGPTDQFVKRYSDLPREAGKLTPLEEKKLHYKKVLDSRGVISNQIVNIINNGGRLLGFDTSKLVMDEFESYDALKRAT